MGGALRLQWPAVPRAGRLLRRAHGRLASAFERAAGDARSLHALQRCAGARWLVALPAAGSCVVYCERRQRALSCLCPMLPAWLPLSSVLCSILSSTSCWHTVEWIINLLACDAI